MFVLTQKEKIVFACLVLAFILGVLIYYFQNGGLAAGREKSIRQTTAERVTQPENPSSRLRVNLNEASAADLEKLPGIGPKTAEAILKLRKTKRRFYRVEDLLEVRGIGPAKLKKIAKVVEVH